MTAQSPESVRVSKVFRQQVILNFIVVAILIALGALLVFKVYGEAYTQTTVLGFVAAVFFSFIVFLPAGTLFAARADFAKGHVRLAADEKTGARKPLADPLMATAPLGVALAAVSTALVWAAMAFSGWTPSPIAATIIAMLFVIPYAYIVWRFIFRDLEGLAAIGPLGGQKAASRGGHIWMSYVVPNVIFQSIINLPLAWRGFSAASAAIADKAGPGMVPAQALAPDLAITFMFVVGFTFLAVVAHTVADMYRGDFGYAGHARGIHGLVYFGLLMLMGVGVGVAVAAAIHALDLVVVSFATSMALKALVVIAAVCVACWLGVGWAGKKFNDAAKAAA